MALHCPVISRAACTRLKSTVELHTVHLSNCPLSFLRHIYVVCDYQSINWAGMREEDEQLDRRSSL